MQNRIILLLLRDDFAAAKEVYDLWFAHNRFRSIKKESLCEK